MVETPSQQKYETIPPLESGDRLNRYEFERRYNAIPHLRKAELIEGVVYVPAALRLFPGLWLAVDDLLTGNMGRVLAVLQQGLAASEHTAFVPQLQT